MSRGLYVTEDIQCLVYTLCRFCAVSAFVSHNTLVHKAGFLCTCTSLRRLHNGEGGVIFLGLVWPINASAYRPLPTRRRNHRRHYSYYWPWPTAADRPVVKVVMCSRGGLSLWGRDAQKHRLQCCTQKLHFKLTAYFPLAFKSRFMMKTAQETASRKRK